MEEAGARHFAQLGCETCHKGNSGGRGPTLVGAYGEPRKLSTGREVVADVDYIRESILHPKAKIVAGYDPIMPVFDGQINEQTLIQIVAYIKSLNPSE
jgi:cytochrome c oxidase subunit 2